MSTERPVNLIIVIICREPLSRIHTSERRALYAPTESPKKRVLVCASFILYSNQSRTLPDCVYTPASLSRVIKFYNFVFIMTT